MSNVSLRFVCCELPAEYESHLSPSVLVSALTVKLQTSSFNDMTVVDLFDHVECVIRDHLTTLWNNNSKDSHDGESSSSPPFCLSVQWEGSVFPMIPLPRMLQDDAKRPLLSCVPSKLLLGRGSSSCVLTIVVSWKSTAPMDDDISSSGDGLCFVLPFGKRVSVAHTMQTTSSLRGVVSRYIFNKNASADAIRFLIISRSNVTIDMDTSMASVLDNSKPKTLTVELSCESKHPLCPMFSKPSYYGGGVRCDSCRQSVDCSTGFLHCKRCRYDVCRTCLNFLLP